MLNLTGAYALSGIYFIFLLIPFLTTLLLKGILIISPHTRLWYCNIWEVHFPSWLLIGRCPMVVGTLRKLSVDSRTRTNGHMSYTTRLCGKSRKPIEKPNFDPLLHKQGFSTTSTWFLASKCMFIVMVTLNFHQINIIISKQMLLKHIINTWWIKLMAIWENR